MQSICPPTLALVCTAVAPVYSTPQFPAAQISQLLLGACVEVLEGAGHWRNVRSEDGYVGWIHESYLLPREKARACAWERGVDGEPVVSLGASLVGSDGHSIMQLPWGAHLLRRAGVCQLPDGRSGRLVGELVEVRHMAERFPPTGESVVRTARRWLGAPYLWGGVTPHGVDCSGLAQAVMWLHGVALPRDSDQQAGVGALLTGKDLARPRAGDLLFFADAERISHVAISTGGAGVIHSALGNGGVACNDLDGDLEFERRLRSLLVHGRRLLPG